MKAAYLIDEKKIDFKTVMTPKAGPNEVLIKVIKTGICGSDLSTYQGTHPYKKAPTILGHEFAGIISAIGEEVTEYKIGDRVCAAAFANCLVCRYCKKNMHHLCIDKSAFSWRDWDGSFAEYVIAKTQKIYRLPDQVSYDDAALIEPLSIGLHALMLTEIENKKLVIIGSGCIGLSTIISAKKLAAKYISAIDVQSNKKQLALSCGADEFKPSIEELSHQADITIIAASYSAAIDDAIKITEPGGTIIVIAYFNHNIQFNMNDLVRKEITLIGSALSEDKDFETIIKWLAKKAINPSCLITHEFPLEKTDEALLLMSTPQKYSGKILLTTSTSTS